MSEILRNLGGEGGFTEAMLEQAEQMQTEPPPPRRLEPASVDGSAGGATVLSGTGRLVAVTVTGNPMVRMLYSLTDLGDLVVAPTAMLSPRQTRGRQAGAVCRGGLVVVGEPAVCQAAVAVAALVDEGVLQET